KKMAVVENFFSVGFFKEQYPDMELVYYTDTVSCLLAVARGEADVFVTDFAVTNYLLKKYRIMNIVQSPPLDLDEFPVVDLRIAVRKDYAILANIINKAIGDISSEKIDFFQKKWHINKEVRSVVEVKQKNDYLLPILGSVIVLIVLVGMLLLPRFFSDEILIRHFGSGGFRKFALIVMSVMSILGSLLVWYTVQQNKKNILTSVKNELTGVLNNYVALNNNLLHEQLEFLNRLGIDPDFAVITKELLRDFLLSTPTEHSSSLGDARNFISSIENKFGRNNFCIVNPSYVNIASNNNNNMGKKNLVAKQRHDLLARAFEGNSVLIPPIQTEVVVQVDDTSQENRTVKQLSMFIAVPVFDLNETVIAVFIQNVVPFGEMTQDIYDSSTAHHGLDSYIINSHGQMVIKDWFFSRLNSIPSKASRYSLIENMEVRDPGVNLVKGYESATPRAKQPFTRMAQDIVRMSREMKQSGSLNEVNEVIVDIEGYRDYKGVPVFGAWTWDPVKGIGTVVETEIEKALTNYFVLRLNIFIIAGMAGLLTVLSATITIMMGERAVRVMRSNQNQLRQQVLDRTDELKNSETRMRNIMDNLLDGIITTDDKGYVESFSLGAEAIFGYTSNEVIGNHIKMIIPKYTEDRMKDLKPGDIKKQGGKRELDGQRQNGTLFPLYLGINELWLNEKYIYTGIVRDVSASKEAELELRKLFSAVENSPASVIITDKNALIEYVNPYFEQMTGFSKEEVVGLNPNILKSEKNSAAIFENMWENLSQGLPWNNEILNKCKDGNEIWNSISIAPLFNNENDITHYVSVQADITANKSTQDALASSNRALNTLSLSNEAVLQAISEQDLAQNICDVLIKQNENAMAWIGLARTDKTVSILAESGFEDGVLENLCVSWDEKVLTSRGPVGRSLITRKSVLINDTEAESNYAPWRETARQIGFQSGIAIPMIHKGELIGSVAVYFKEPYWIDTEGVKAIEKLTKNVAFRIISLRSEEARLKAEQTLKFTQFAIDHAAEAAFWIHPEDAGFVYVNKSAFNMLGYSRDELLKLKIWDVDISLPIEKWSELLERFRNESAVTFESQYVRKDG
ncbi:PAS domain S-box protein, partial [bacterium]|nr:PAS domain S-box protein [bacterium]